MVKLALEAIEAASCGCTLQDFEALVVNTTPMIEEAMEDVMKIIRGEASWVKRTMTRRPLWAMALPASRWASRTDSGWPSA